MCVKIADMSVTDCPLSIPNSFVCSKLLVHNDTVTIPVHCTLNLV